MPNAEKNPVAAEEFLLDASAVLALLRDEPGADTVRMVLARARIHAVNLAEVVKKLVEVQVPMEEIELSIEELQVPIIEELTVQQAMAVGKLASAGRRYGLSLGDCVCLGVAALNGSTAVTSERIWGKISNLGADVLVIR